MEKLWKNIAKKSTNPVEKLFKLLISTRSMPRDSFETL